MTVPPLAPARIARSGPSESAAELGGASAKVLPNTRGWRSPSIGP
jgi:hypothetical protein